MRLLFFILLLTSHLSSAQLQRPKPDTNLQDNYWDSFSQTKNSTVTSRMGANTLAQHRYLIEFTLPTLLQVKQEFSSTKNQTLSSSLANNLNESLIEHQKSIRSQKKLFQQALNANGVKFKSLRTHSTLINASVMELNTSDVEGIRAMPHVKNVHLDTIYKVNPISSQYSHHPEQQNNLSLKNETNYTGKGVKIAVLDTGVNYKHVSLGGCFGIECKVVDGYDFVDNDTDPMDEDGHGTHVTGIIAGDSASFKGVAPEATIYAYRVLDSESQGYASNIVAALEAAVDPDGNPATNDAVHVANLSFSGPGDADSIVSKAVNAAHAAGMLVITAAGNNGDYETILSPGNAEKALTVGSIDDAGYPSYFSSKGPKDLVKFIKPELVAPGNDIRSAGLSINSTKFRSGTSMSAAYVTGVAALLIQQDSTLDNNQVKSKLVSGAKPQNYDPFVVGAGATDLQQSLANNIVLDTPTVHLGRVNKTLPFWQGTRTLTLKNEGAEDQLLKIAIETEETFASLTASKNEVLVPAGSSAEIQLEYSVEVDNLQFNTTGFEGKRAHGIHYFSVLLSNEQNRISLPVLFEHNNPVVIYEDDSNFSFNVYDPDTWQHEATYPYGQLNTESLTVRFPYERLSFIFTGSYPSKIYKGSGGGEGLPYKGPVQSFIIYENLKLSENATITATSNRLKHEIRFNEVTHQSNAFSYSQFQKLNFHTKLYIGEQVLFDYQGNYGCQYANMDSLPSLYYFSNVPEGLRLSNKVQYINRENPYSIDVIDLVSDVAVKNVDLNVRTDTSAAGTKSFHFEASKSNPVMLGLNNYCYWEETLSKDVTINYYASSVHPSTLSGSRIDFYSALETADDGKANNIASTGRFGLNGNQELVKRSPTSQSVQRGLSYFDVSGQDLYTDHFRTNEPDITFSKRIKFWSAKANRVQNYLSLENTQFPVEGWDHGFVRDIFHNTYNEQIGITAEIICDDQSSLYGVRAFTDDYWWFSDDYLHRLTDQCSDLDVMYPVVFENMELTAKAQYRGKSEGEYPTLKNLTVKQKGVISELIDNIDHHLEFEIQTDSGLVEQVNLSVKSAESQVWNVIYEGIKSGVHSTPLPIPTETTHLDLKVVATATNGNQFSNIIPSAITIGINAGGLNDVDSDGIENERDTDNDNDGIPDSNDQFPYDPLEQMDFDNDGIGDTRDIDDDNDGIPDGFETENGLNPLNAEDAYLDADEDGLSNIEEYELGTSIANSDTDGDGISDAIEVSLNMDPTSYDAASLYQNFNGDKIGDLLTRNSTSNLWSTYNVDLSGESSAVGIDGASKSSNWEFQGIADFDRDNQSDILIRNQKSGRWFSYFIVESAIASKGYIELPEDLKYQYVASLDINSDGYSDILLRHTESHEWHAYLMKKRTVIDSFVLPFDIGSEWQFISSGKFNNHGLLDILLWNQENGDWLLYSSTDDPQIFIQGSLDFLFKDHSYSPVVVGNLNGDDFSDIVMFNKDKNSWRFIMLDDNSIKSDGFNSTEKEGREFSGLNDFDGDGIDELIFRDLQENGSLYIWNVASYWDIDEQRLNFVIPTSEKILH